MTDNETERYVFAKRFVVAGERKAQGIPYVRLDVSLEAYKEEGIRADTEDRVVKQFKDQFPGRKIDKQFWLDLQLPGSDFDESGIGGSE